jgi:hypothetical protein
MTEKLSTLEQVLNLRQKSSDPRDPFEGDSIIWMSDGTDTGNEGDTIIKTTVGGVSYLRIIPKGSVAAPRAILNDGSEPFIGDQSMGGFFLTTIGALQFKTDADPLLLTEGQVQWDETDHCLSFVTGLGNVIQIGQEDWCVSVNKTGGTAVDGEVVYFSGVQGNRPTYDYADARDGAKVSCVGVVTASTANNAEGPVTKQGMVRGFDTSAWAAGTKLYIAADATGTLTSTPPTGPDFVIWVATVLNQHATQGIIFVSPRLDYGNGITLMDLFIGNETDLYAVLDAVAASDFKLDCGTAKTLELQETVWDDLRVPVTAVKLGGVNDPGFQLFRDDGAGSTGVFSYAFIGTGILEEELFFAAQLPHTYKEGTDILAHVHWSPSTAAAGNVVWQMEYTKSSVNGTFGNTTLLTGTADSTDSTQYKHLVATVGTISGTGMKISDVIICRIFRDPAHASDTYGADAFLHEIDFHFEVNTMGSRQEFIK